MSMPLFLISSMFEWSALIILSFALFMFKIRDNIIFILFAAALLSLLSYILREASNLAMVSLFIQLITLFLIFWLMARVQPIYAGVMATSGYVAYSFIQTLIALLLSWTNILPFEKMMGNQYLLLLLSFITVSVILTTCRILVRMRIGFSFVPDDSSIKIGLRGNIKLLVMIILGTATLGIYLFSAKHGFLQWVFLGMAVILGFLFYFLLQKEAEE